MRIARAVSIASTAVALAGIGLVGHGLIANAHATYRAGIAALVLGVGGVLLGCLQMQEARLTEIVIAAASASEAERQHYADLGMRAAWVEARSSAPDVPLAPVVDLRRRAASLQRKTTG